MNALKKSELETKIIKLAPDTARNFVALAGPNRYTQPILVKFFEEIIADGFWRLTHQGIAFDTTGRLVDGLHRCTAIGNGKTTVPIMATWNLPPDALDAIDLGKKRTPADIINIRERTPGRVSSAYTAVARAMVESISGSSSERISVPTLINLVIHHFEAIHFVQEHGSRLCAFIKAPVARAWYSKDRDRLAEFLFVASHGVSENSKDTAAAFLMMKFAKEHERLGSTERATWYRRTESAIQAFLKGRSITKLYEVKEEQFAIPDMKED